jgi:hypothetical protein
MVKIWKNKKVGFQNKQMEPFYESFIKISFKKVEFGTNVLI